MPRSSVDRILLALLCAYAVGSAWLFRDWWVDDAAITFAYARNLAQGDGLVAFPGAERSEGFSNPLWMALLALGQVAGIDPFALSKILGALLAAATVPLTWAAARQIPLPDTVPAARRWVPLLAAAVVATNAQHLIWAQAGLENALFTFLVALGCWRVATEADRGGIPWSALVFALVALTHSEGAMYGAAALALAAVVDLRARRWPRIAAWALVFALPIVAYELFRYLYFGLPLPLPYYAKLGRHDLHFFGWRTRAWQYTVTWSLQVGWLAALPVVLAGIARLRGWRWKLAAGWGLALAATAAAAALTDTAPATSVAHQVRILLLVAMTAAAPLLAWRRDEGPARALHTAVITLTLAFAVYTGGDWMDGFRRFAVIAVPLGILYAAGAAELLSRLPRLTRKPLALLLAALPLVWSSVYLGIYSRQPVRMTPMNTRLRMDLYDDVAARIHLHRPWISVDHAMGGMVWYRPDQHTTIDWYGLTEPVFALHQPLRDFALDYLLDPAPRFDLAHLEPTIGITRNKRFRKLYFKIPGKRGTRKDDWLRRDLVTTTRWTQGRDPVRFRGGLRLAGLSTRVPTASAAGGLYVEVSLRRGKKAPPDFAIRVRLDGPTRFETDLSPDYDGLFPARMWRPGETVIRRAALPLPDTLPPGSYSVSATLVDDAGEILSLLAGTDEAQPWSRPRRIELSGEEAARTAAEADWQRAADAAAAGDCEEADDAWRDAVLRLPLDSEWEATLTDRARHPLAACWAAQAADADDIRDALPLLAAARRWDRRSPDALAVGEALAAATEAAAQEARAAGDHAFALALFQAMVEADPRRSKARRLAEEARTAVIADSVRPGAE